MTQRTFNGWLVRDYPSPHYFTAPNGKRVYCADADVATIFEYVARQWHERIEAFVPATVNEYPGERTGHIVIHAHRPLGSGVGTGDVSNHCSATGMDIYGERHPYEWTNPPHLKGPNYRDGFSDSQRNTLYAIRNEVGKARGRWVIRLGIDFPIGRRDGMHVEIAPGISNDDVRATAARLRATEVVIDLTHVHTMLTALGYPATEAGVKAYQKDRGLTVDGRPGKITTAALEADMATLKEIAAEQKRQAQQLDTIERVARQGARDAKWAGPDRAVGNLIPRINDAVKAILGDTSAAARLDAAQATAEQED